MMKILLTGRPGVGKTTIVKKVVAAHGLPLAGGFLTEEIRQRGQRVGFGVKDIYTWGEGILAHADRKGPPRVGRYGVDIASFERIGVTALREGLLRDGCIIIDEIGKMELFSDAFREAVTEVFDSAHPVLASIPLHSRPFLDRLRERPDVTLIEITPSNRSALPERLAGMLTQGE